MKYCPHLCCCYHCGLLSTFCFVVVITTLQLLFSPIFSRCMPSNLQGIPSLTLYLIDTGRLFTLHFPYLEHIVQYLFIGTAQLLDTLSSLKASTRCSAQGLNSQLLTCLQMNVLCYSDRHNLMKAGVYNNRKVVITKKNNKQHVNQVRHFRQKFKK